MLPNPALKPVYEDIVWLYVYRDFSRNEADRAASTLLRSRGVPVEWPQAVRRAKIPDQVSAADLRGRV